MFSLIALGTLKQDCDIKTTEILSFHPLKSNSVTLGINFLLPSISALSYHQTLFTLFFSLLDYSLLNFYKHHQLYVNNQKILFGFFNILIPTLPLPLISNSYLDV